MQVDWNQYTKDLKGGTGTDKRLLLDVARGRVLDIGCGVGSHLASLRWATQRVGIDPGLAGMRKGKQAHGALQFVNASAHHIPVVSGSIDTVVMIDVLEHLHGPAGALREIHRVLKDSGKLFLQTPNYPVKRLYDVWHWMRGSRTTFKDDVTHVSKFGTGGLLSTVTDAGYEILLCTARNVFLEKHLRVLSMLKRTRVGKSLGQKTILVARKSAMGPAAAR